MTIATLDGYHSYTDVNRATVVAGVVTEVDILDVGPVSSSGSPTIVNGALNFDGTNDKYDYPDLEKSIVTITPNAYHQIPDASGAAAGKGFTCTGLSPGPGGTWFLGNDGRTQEGDASTNLSSVVKLSADLLTVVQEVTTASLGLAVGSVQGVVWIEDLNLVAFANLGDNTIRFLNATDMTYAGQMPGTVIGLNGLSYDPTIDAMITLTTNGSARWHDRVTGDISKTVAFVDDVTDQIHYDSVNSWIWYTTGANGSAGKVRIRLASDPTYDIAYYPLSGAQAVEGVSVRDGKLWVANDQYFHPTADAATNLNRVVEYPLPTPKVWRANGSTFQFFGIIRVPVSPASTAPLMEIGNSLSSGSGLAGIWTPSTTSVQLIANAISGVFTVPSMATELMVYGNIDLTTDVAELWVNGVSIGTILMSGSGTTTPNTAAASDPSFGWNPAGRWFKGEVRAVGATIGALGDREIVEGYMAHEVGRTGLLPSGHPYKASPPSFASARGKIRMTRPLINGLIGRTTL